MDYDLSPYIYLVLFAREKARISIVKYGNAHQVVLMHRGVGNIRRFLKFKINKYRIIPKVPFNYANMI